MDLSALIPFLVNVLVGGLLLGFVYAIVALGYTMVYGILQLINFAHSEVFITGAVIGYEVFRIFQGSGLDGYVQLFIALVVAMIVSGLLNVAIERLAYRKLRDAPRLVPLITAIGISLALQDVIKFLENTQGRFDLTYQLPEGFSRQFCNAESGCAQFGDLLRNIGISLQIKDVILIVVSLVSLAILNYIVNHTRMGKAIRAVAQDRVTANLMGINSDVMISLTFLIGGALGGVSGVLFGMKFNTVNAYSGFEPGLIAFTAAVLGGIGSIPGAVLGGLVLGVIQNLIGSISVFGSILGVENISSIDDSYKRIGAFLVLVLILLFKPTGLLGKSNVEKV